MNRNTYVPLPVKVKDIHFESKDRMLRTIDLEFVNKEDSFKYMPGQFCQLSIFGKGESPLGIASSPTEKDFLRFTVSKVGVVTTALHYLQHGDEIGIRGPLGNYYPVNEFKGKNIVIIGGGFGITTLRSLAVYLKEFGERQKYGNITFLYGARNPDAMIYFDEFKSWYSEDSIDLYLTIDKKIKGWDGLTGFIPDVVKNIKPSSNNSVVVICGPPIMIKYTLPVLVDLGFKKDAIYTSLERKMKCGIGKCGRCNVGSKYVCVDGPVFSYNELIKLQSDF